MSGYRIIKDLDGDTVEIGTTTRGVYVTVMENNKIAGVVLSVDQCAALIAAITDAARVVTGEKA